MLSSKSIILNLIHRCNDLISFKQIHAQLITSGLISDDFVVNKVAEHLGNSVAFADYACKFLLNHFDIRSNSFPLNSVIAGCAGGNHPKSAISVYRRLLQSGFSPDAYTFPVLFKSCSKFSGVLEGRQIHGALVKQGFWLDIYVQNSLLHFYGACGECCDAGKVFDEMPERDIVSWTGLISGYVSAGLFHDALDMFSKMNIMLNTPAFVSVLVACGRVHYLALGKIVHGSILKYGLCTSLVVRNALLDMYIKCESLSESKQLFNEHPDKDIVSWTSLISGLIQCNRPNEALELFNTMQKSGFEPDKFMLTSILSACSSLGALDYGRWIHDYIDRRGIKWDIHLGTSMVDMYAKCGCIELALDTFNGVSKKNVFTWNALLGGLAMNGHGKEAIKQFEHMIRLGERPNEVTFLAIVEACSHSGLVDDGRRIFHMMKNCNFNYSPRLEHYGCMVDLMCRAGFLEEAWDIIRAMPMAPDVMILGAFLNACKDNNVELSPDILERFHEIEEHDTGVFVLLSNLYASSERWDGVSVVRKLMKRKGMRKAPGSSVVEVDGKAHEFLVGDIAHPRSDDIHLILGIFYNQAHSEVQFSPPFL